jgi:hypothetical protein
MFHIHVDDRDLDLPESVARTRRIALLCGILGCVMMMVSVLGLMS